MAVVLKGPEEIERMRVAGRLASGLEFERIGPIARTIVTDCGYAAPTVENPGLLRGVVIGADRFGNLVTNIREEHVDRLAGGRRHESLEVRLGRRRLGGLLRTYADVEPGRVVCLFGSNGELEIALRNGDAAARLRAKPGAQVTVRSKESR